MALKITDLAELKYYKIQLERTKASYDEVINNLYKTIKNSALYWQGEDGNIFRRKIYSLLKYELLCISKEMNAEIEYLGKIILVLENAQEQIKNRLNG